MPGRESEPRCVEQTPYPTYSECQASAWNVCCYYLPTETEKFSISKLKASTDSFLKFINTSWTSMGQGTAKPTKKHYADRTRLCLDDRFRLIWSGTYCTGWGAVSEWTKHPLLKLSGPLLDWIAFFIRDMKQLHSEMLPDRRNAAGTEFVTLQGTLAITHFDWLH